MNDEDTPAYVSRCKCGCGAFIFAAVDIPDMQKSNAQEVGKLIHKGYAVERTTIGVVRKSQFTCQSLRARIADLGGRG